MVQETLNTQLEFVEELPAPHLLGELDQTSYQAPTGFGRPDRQHLVCLLGVEATLVVEALVADIKTIQFLLKSITIYIVRTLFTVRSRDGISR